MLAHDTKTTSRDRLFPNSPKVHLMGQIAYSIPNHVASLAMITPTDQAETPPDDAVEVK